MNTGNDQLSARDLHLWTIVREVAIQYETLVIFTERQMDVPRGVRGLVRFFICKDTTYLYEIEQFLKEELAALRYEPCEAPDGTVIPGCDFVILTFDRLPVFLPRDAWAAIAKEAMRDIIVETKKAKKKNKDDASD